MDSRHTAEYRKARIEVSKRDHGVCAKCGRDTIALSEALDFYSALHLRHPSEGWPSPRELARAIGPAARRWPHSLWECNHIVALEECGELSNLENLETLCIPCHQAHTRSVIQWAAKAKRRMRKFGPGDDGQVVAQRAHPKRKWPVRKLQTRRILQASTRRGDRG